jgi:hypothetical protein
MRSTAMKLLLVVLCLGFSLGWAQEDEDKAGPGVARISLLNGDVSVRRGDSGDLVAAAVNAPLMTGDHLLTGANSRAELQFDYGTMIRLGPDSDVRIADLESRLYQVQVASGTVTFRVLRSPLAQSEIDTPSVSVRPVKQGSYRISVNPDGESVITVRSGDADIYSPRGSQQLHAGQTMYARGSAADPEFQVASAIGRDEWDAWNEDRDHRLEQSKSYQYVSRDIYGADDLDSYGRWVWTPEYGWVWAPTVGPNWAPYRDGRWIWGDYYGWTWLGYEPWGWAPYHYGRWWHASFGWCWYPGSIHSAYFWRPALVGFFGFGHGVGVGIGFGSYGWVPLAPYERFHPWYGGRGGYGRGVTIVNNVNIVNNYRNARIANAVSGIPANEFGRGQRGRITPVSNTLLRQGSGIRGVVPVTPSANSLRFSDRQVSTAGLPRTAGRQERFATRHQPAQVTRTSFQEQQRGMEQVVQRTFGNRTATTGTAGSLARTPAGRSGSGAVAPSAPAAQSNSRGWRSLGQGGASPAVGAQAPAARTDSRAHSWRQFGQAPANSAPAAAARTSPPASASGARRAVQPASPAQNGSANWRRFSEPAGRVSTPAGSADSRAVPSFRGESRSTAPARSASPADGNANWRGFRNAPSGSSSPGYSQDRGSAPARQSAPAYESPRSAPQGQIHISPPIVRERSAPSGDSGRSYSRGGGSSPQYRSGGSSAPQSRSGGSSGGWGHSSGGGGRSSTSGRGGRR